MLGRRTLAGLVLYATYAGGLGTGLTYAAHHVTTPAAGQGDAATRDATMVEIAIVTVDGSEPSSSHCWVPAHAVATDVIFVRSAADIDDERLRLGCPR